MTKYVSVLLWLVLLAPAWAQPDLAQYYQHLSKQGLTVETLKALGPLTEAQQKRAELILSLLGAEPAGQLLACKSNLKNIGTALEMYSVDHQGKYPDSLAKVSPDYLIIVPTCPTVNHDTYSGTYSAGQGGQAYTVYCAGHHHASQGLPADSPSYNWQTGLVDSKGQTPPLGLVTAAKSQAVPSEYSAGAIQFRETSRWAFDDQPQERVILYLGGENGPRAFEPKTGAMSSELQEIIVATLQAGKALPSSDNDPSLIDYSGEVLLDRMRRLGPAATGVAVFNTARDAQLEPLFKALQPKP